MRLQSPSTPVVAVSSPEVSAASRPSLLASCLTHLRRAGHLYLLLILTAFAAFLRLYYINYPAIWNDEAHVYRRITGSFQELLDIIQNDGFAPLHYELYWYLAHKLGGENLTAFWMRLVPSIAGTLMVPAMYFLARQLCTKRASLLVAAFTATSAYMMVYSHDAKMYAHFWLFCALNMGCMLWWTRSGLFVAWLAWVASGLAMLGLHAIGGFLLGLQLLIFLTARYIHWKRFIVFIIGASIMASAPIVHYFGFNRWAD